MTCFTEDSIVKLTDSLFHQVFDAVAAPGGAPVGTRAFAEAAIARIGEQPRTLPAVAYRAEDAPIRVAAAPPRRAEKGMDGVDVFVHAPERDPERLASRLRTASDGVALELQMITNRGVKVWPEGVPETFCADHWRCRFLAAAGAATNAEVLGLLGRLDGAGVEFVKTEGLYRFDGEPGYSLGQGQ